MASGDIIRTQKIKHPKGYLQSLTKTADVKAIAHDDLAIEYFMNHARLYEPMPKQAFETFTGLPAQAIANKFKQRRRKVY